MSKSIILATFIVGLAALLPALAESQGNGADSILAYIGTYTNSGKSKGIYICKLDRKSGQLSKIATSEGIKNPSYLTIHPDGKHLYAVSELGKQDGKPAGALWAYKIDDKSGKLTLLNHQLTGGQGPCYVSIDSTGQAALVANYNDGSVSSFELKADGSLSRHCSFIRHKGSSIDPKRQTGPHAHSINVSPDNQFALVADLGMDKIMIYRLHPASAKLKKSEPAFSSSTAGSGPRHLIFSADGHHVYVSNELSSTVSVYNYDASNGSLEEIQSISTLPANVVGNTVAELRLHPSGKFLYCSNRGYDSLCIFKVDGESGKLSYVGQQKTAGQVPRYFSIDPSGQFLLVCNQESDSVIVFKIDAKTGALTQSGDALKIPSPVCVKFLSG